VPASTSACSTIIGRAARAAQRRGACVRAPGAARPAAPAEGRDGGLAASAASGPWPRPSATITRPLALERKAQPSPQTFRPAPPAKHRADADAPVPGGEAPAGAHARHDDRALRARWSGCRSPARAGARRPGRCRACRRWRSRRPGALDVGDAGAVVDGDHLHLGAPGAPTAAGALRLRMPHQVGRQLGDHQRQPPGGDFVQPAVVASCAACRRASPTRLASPIGKHRVEGAGIISTG
jgi:hypothetical protein